MRVSAVAIAVLTGVVLMANTSGAFAKEMHGDKKMNSHHQKIEKKHDGKFLIHAMKGKLAVQGYKQIVFTDQRLPVYKAKACKHGDRFKLHLNKWGKIVKRNRVGNCHKG